MIGTAINCDLKRPWICVLHLSFIWVNMLPELNEYPSKRDMKSKVQIVTLTLSQRNLDMRAIHLTEENIPKLKDIEQT